MPVAVEVVARRSLVDNRHRPMQRLMAVPPEGYGHFMGTFEAILELPGTSSRVMRTSGSVDVMVPTI